LNATSIGHNTHTQWYSDVSARYNPSVPTQTHCPLSPSQLNVCLSPVFTYRYFLQRFPELCILACPADKPDEPIGCVVGKIDPESDVAAATGTTGESSERTGYIGMLAVVASHRRLGIGSSLVKEVLRRMKDMGCVSVTLETEVRNAAAQRLYQDTFGFIREELLVRYYLNWGDAYRLRLWLLQSQPNVTQSS
jgi:N-alpha-acetyltransferase 30